MKPTLSQLRTFIGNPDAYAVQRHDGQWSPRRERLTDKVLREHLTQRITVGTYIGHVEKYGPPINDELTVSRTLCLDVDTGFEADAQALAFILTSRLRVPEQSVGIEFSGRKGYHVWVMLPDYKRNAEVRRLGRAANALAALDVEVYPKQDNVKDLGNLVKLPGGIHRVSKKPNNFVGAVPVAMSQDEWLTILEVLPPEVQARSTHTEEVRFPCMAAIQDEGVQEGSRNISLVHLGVMLRRAGVTPDFIEHIVRAVNERGDPVDEEELQQILARSAQTGPLCSQLPQDRQCGDLCLQARLSGLRDYPGQLRGAAVGERVVVTVEERKGDELTFSHSDVGKMRGILREAK